MSWIQQNKFVASLIAATVVLSALLLYFGSKGSSRYQQLLTDFQEASAQVSSYERIDLYPSQENLDGKAKALSDYEEAIGELKGGFEKFRKEPPERISPQEFGNRLVATNETISSRLRSADVTLPAGFYSGFEAYTASLAQSGATAVLSRQLEIVDAVMGNLASARPAEILNFRRERQPEEGGGSYEPRPGNVARPHSFEVTFRGTEASARRFVTSLADTSERFVVMRTLRILNESPTAPKSSSAQFTPAAGVGGAAPAPGPFDGGFFGAFDDFAADDADGDGDGDEAEAAPAQPAPQAPAPRNDGARMLGQVAGDELLEVFLRFDVMEFLPQPSSPPSDES